MKGTIGRRVFVGSVAAGLPLVVSASSGSSTSPNGQVHRHVEPGEGPDVMFDHAIRQVAAIANRVRARGATAEDARLVAAHASTLAIYTHLAGLDTQAVAAMRELVQARRQSGAPLQIDQARARAALRRYRVEIDERVFAIPRPDHKTQERVLEDLVTLGMTGLFKRMASTFERTAAELDRRDRRAAGAAGIRLVQDDSAQAQVCQLIWLDLVRLSAESAAACAAMFFMPQFDAPCVMAQSALVVLMAAYYALC